MGANGRDQTQIRQFARHEENVYLKIEEGCKILEEEEKGMGIWD